MGYEGLDLQPDCEMLSWFIGYVEPGWEDDLKMRLK